MNITNIEEFVEVSSVIGYLNARACSPITSPLAAVLRNEGAEPTLGAQLQTTLLHPLLISTQKLIKTYTKLYILLSAFSITVPIKRLIKLKFMYRTLKMTVIHDKQGSQSGKNGMHLIKFNVKVYRVIYIIQCMEFKIRNYEI